MNCRKCKAHCKWTGSQGSEHGKCLVGYVPRTHADEIRAMTDEELAKWFVNLEVKILNIQPMLDRPALEKDWLEWLKEEV